MATPIPDNHALFSPEELLAFCGGWTLVGEPRTVAGVATDSRRKLHGKLFVALVGERFDGHDFIAQARDAGAVAVLVSRETIPPEDAEGLWVVHVADTLMALGDLALAHRRRWKGTLVAVAGSAGKTSTRSAIAAALEAVSPHRVHGTSGNLNNRVGVPMVLFGLGPEHELAVVEIGTNQRGEVAELARISAPDASVLTLVDWEHAEGIGDLDAIEAEEGDLLRATRKLALANGDDPRALRQLAASPARRKLSYGTGGDCDVRLSGRVYRALAGSELRIERAAGAVTVSLPIVGVPMALAATGAVAVADGVCELRGRSPLAPDALETALSDGAIGEPGRLEPRTASSGALVLDDSYNANPASMRAAIVTALELCRERGLRLLLVLGEMRELGSFSEAEHGRLGAFIEASMEGVPVDLLVTVAGAAKLTSDAARFNRVEALHVNDAAAALQAVSAIHSSDHLILVKGSRGVRLEQLVEGLVRGRPEAGGPAGDDPA